MSPALLRPLPMGGMSQEFRSPRLETAIAPVTASTERSTSPSLLTSLLPMGMSGSMPPECTEGERRQHSMTDVIQVPEVCNGSMSPVCNERDVPLSRTWCRQHGMMDVFPVPEVCNTPRTVAAQPEIAPDINNDLPVVPNGKPPAMMVAGSSQSSPPSRSPSPKPTAKSSLRGSAKSSAKVLPSSKPSPKSSLKPSPNTSASLKPSANTLRSASSSDRRSAPKPSPKPSPKSSPTPSPKPSPSPSPLPSRSSTPLQRSNKKSLSQSLPEPSPKPSPKSSAKPSRNPSPNPSPKPSPNPSPQPSRNPSPMRPSGRTSAGKSDLQARAGTQGGMSEVGNSGLSRQQSSASVSAVAAARRPMSRTGSTAQLSISFPQNDPRSFVQALSKTDMSELKKLIPSCQVVVKLMQAVSILFEERLEWTTAKKMLGNANFLQRMLDFDQNRVTDSKLQKLEKYIQDPEFQEDEMEKISKSAKCLCSWVRGIYYRSNIRRSERGGKDGKRGSSSTKKGKLPGRQQGS
eukprot:gnl/MRDRNA2_/MRDRNA2_45321_c0_seq1.p1 gnl/MRDRNA2_/MRDRNA2_45321_c0~~gnl/MRDRNA2_/MRDRNA2_45321_c0_seq1.p1  ORF type:complete len:549 (+),score=77.64 gnl/MRDRNA2_/MRDRNA2_45321_c0_seq1:97-1647(+)